MLQIMQMKAEPGSLYIKLHDGHDDHFSNLIYS